MNLRFSKSMLLKDKVTVVTVVFLNAVVDIWLFKPASFQALCMHLENLLLVTACPVRY